MIQNVVPLLPGSDFDKLSQEKRRSLGDGGQLCDVFGLPLQAVDLHRDEGQIQMWGRRLQADKGG